MKAEHCIIQGLLRNLVDLLWQKVGGAVPWTFARLRSGDVQIWSTVGD